MRVISSIHLHTFEVCLTGRIFKDEETSGFFSPNLLDIYLPDGILSFVRVHIGFCIGCYVQGLSVWLKK